MVAYLWGNKARIQYLLFAAAVILLACLGSRDIWTQEHRWADIVAGMFYRHDYFHPFLGENDYYDKPLLSYWLIVLFSKIMGGLSTWALRLPSVLAAMLAVFSMVRLGTVLKDKSFGMLAGWLLLTTYYFLFWARTSSADMLNLGGTLFAVAWYFDHREQTKFKDYAVFFIIIALTCLCKGLIGAVVPLMVVGIDMLLQRSVMKHLNRSLLMAILPAILIYVVPFLASSMVTSEAYHQNGLYLVYRENILRYFQPFDHQGPIYTYLLYLPIYTMPWAIFLLPALWTLPKRFSAFSVNSRWICWSLFALFMFFTLSGSRRSYYVLPMVPFAQLFIADWMMQDSKHGISGQQWMPKLLIGVFVTLLLAVDLVPAWYYGEVGVNRFASILKNEAEKIEPWQGWQVTLLDAESKLNFYLQLPPQTKNYQIKGVDRQQQTAATLEAAWPLIMHPNPANRIFITRERYVPLIQSHFSGYKQVRIKSNWINSRNKDAPVAFIPASLG